MPGSLRGSVDSNPPVLHGKCHLGFASASGFGTELAAFLASRIRVRDLGGANGQPMIDSDLPFDLARPFISDCSAIGLEVQARLRGR